MDTFIGNIRKKVMGTINTKFMVLIKKRETGLNNNLKKGFFNYLLWLF